MTSVPPASKGPPDDRVYAADVAAVRARGRSVCPGTSRVGAARRRREEPQMPPRGVKPGTKRARQYEHVKESELEQGASEDRAEEIAARTVNKERARSGEARTRSRSSTRDISSGRRGGKRSGRRGP